MPTRIVIALLLGVISLATVAGERVVTKSDLGDRWPLTVDSGTLRCRPFRGNLQILTIEVGGKAWAVNGTAKGQGYADIEPIWAPNPKIPEARINISSLIELGKTLCR